MKIFLLNPPVKKRVEKKDTPDYQHIGLGYLASAVVQAGYDVEALDAKLERKKVKQAIKMVEQYCPDVLGVSAMTHQIDDAADFARKYKEKHPKTTTVIGGVHVTAMPVETLRQYAQFDFGIAGEGEFAFVELLHCLRLGGSNLEDISGLVYRDGTRILNNSIARIRDINVLPLPSWTFFSNIKVYNIITSRGCPHSCNFCMRAFGKTVRQRDIDSIIQEITGVLADLKPERIFFRDETFIKDKNYIYTLCHQLIKQGINQKIKWGCNTRADSIEKDILKIMKEAGCDHIEFGVESGNAEILKKSKKGITKDQARDAVKIAKATGYHVECGFILGHPDETLATALETIDFASQLNPSLIQLGIMVPYPGTEIREMALNGQGGYRLLSADWRDYNKQLGSALELESLSRADLERLQLIGYLRLFVHNKRLADFLKFVVAFRREMFSYLGHIWGRRANRQHRAKSSCQISFRQTLKHIFATKIV